MIVRVPLIGWMSYQSSVIGSLPGTTAWSLVPLHDVVLANYKCSVTSLSLDCNLMNWSFCALEAAYFQQTLLSLLDLTASSFSVSTWPHAENNKIIFIFFSNFLNLVTDSGSRFNRGNTNQPGLSPDYLNLCIASHVTVTSKCCRNVTTEGQC